MHHILRTFQNFKEINKMQFTYYILLGFQFDCKQYK